MDLSKQDQDTKLTSAEMVRELLQNGAVGRRAASPSLLKMLKVLPSLNVIKEICHYPRLHVSYWTLSSLTLPLIQISQKKKKRVVHRFLINKGIIVRIKLCLFLCLSEWNCGYICFTMIRTQGG